ncbi:hypothetical protein E2562_020065 [Oryza meyeriana var. granulata]|uniref:Uncharacterized protein n=1 Tax=Oryza meyeriana var. granulata TaxID=110450 RepID=A0A6G1BYI0_9ORYZ|nr:hypothetical protein E2562_020065 [Oryza meyeriana var. granulata]
MATSVLSEREELVQCALREAMEVTSHINISYISNNYGETRHVHSESYLNSLKSSLKVASIVEIKAREASGSMGSSFPLKRATSS